MEESCFEVFTHDATERRKLVVCIVVWTALSGAFLTCAPDGPDHACVPGSSGYNECILVDAGSACTHNSQCAWQNGVCVEGSCECYPSCADRLPGEEDGCGGCCSSCHGKECGDDGCGGICKCEPGWQCDGDQHCFDPCAGKECGDDGYGGSCGDCVALYGEQYVCADCMCVCQPACAEKECGDDACGGTCGTCPVGKSCQAGNCQLVVCGDGQCGQGENKCNCPGDCTGGCAGCCAGTQCKAGTSNDDCGKDAAACAACSDGKTCQNQVCTVKCGDGQCGPGEDKCNCPADCTGGCAGCCSGTQCKAGTSIGECGKNGAVCANCSCKVCQNGQCVSSMPLAWCDPTSDLTWQVTPTGGKMSPSNPKVHCAGLDLGGHTDWRLPTISELRSLLRGCPGTVTGGACEVTDSCLSSSCFDEGACFGCSGGDGPADGCYWPGEMAGTCSRYWSLSSLADFDYGGWSVMFNFGRINYYVVVPLDSYVRCVRDAP